MFRSLTILVALLPLALAGCGGDVLVEGQFTWDGKPLPEKLDTMASFTNVEGEGSVHEKSFPVILNKDGTFKVPGYFKTGIPPAKYRISFFGGKLGKNFPPGKSDLIIDVSSANRRPTIELNLEPHSARPLTSPKRNEARLGRASSVRSREVSLT